MRIIFFCTALLVSAIASAQSPKTKIVYVDVDYILGQLPEIKEMEQKMQETRSKLQSDFTTRQQKFQKDYSDFTTNMATMADSVRDSTLAKLQSVNAELQQFPQEAQRTLENTRKLYLMPLYLKIGNTISQVAVENGYEIILPKKIENQTMLLFADPKMNISDLVLKKFGITPSQKPSVK